MKKRLEAIKCLVKPGLVVADIGTDHAYIPCSLIQENLTPKCYACDVIPGPLKIAKKNIEQRGLNEKIQVIQSDGLLNVPRDTEVIIIAGMGFMTAKKILEEGLKLHPQLKQVIVQVNKEVDELRRWIGSNGYTIEDEVIVLEQHYYQIVSFSCCSHSPYTEEEIYFGPCLMEKKEKLFIEYYKKVYNQNLDILSKASQSDPRRSSLEKLNEMIKNMLGENETAQ